MRKIRYTVTLYTETEVPTSIELSDQLRKVDQVVAGFVNCDSIDKSTKESMQKKIEVAKEKTMAWWLPGGKDRNS